MEHLNIQLYAIFIKYNMFLEMIYGYNFPQKHLNL